MNSKQFVESVKDSEFFQILLSNLEEWGVTEDAEDVEAFTEEFLYLAETVSAIAVDQGLSPILSNDTLTEIVKMAGTYVIRERQVREKLMKREFDPLELTVRYKPTLRGSIELTMPKPCMN